MLDTMEITRKTVVPTHVRNGRFSRKFESGYNDQETLLLYGRTKTGTTKAGATKKPGRPMRPPRLFQLTRIHLLHKLNGEQSQIQLSSGSLRIDANHCDRLFVPDRLQFHRPASHSFFVTSDVPVDQQVNLVA